MKGLFTSLAAALLLAALPPAAFGAEARSLPEALNKAGRSPVVVFIYGANYDKVSMKAYEEFVGRRKLSPALHRCVFLTMPVYQLPNEKQEAEMKRMMGDKQLPSGIWSYPCLAVLDAENNLRGIVQKPEEMKTPEAAIAALKPILEDFRDQQKLLAKADRAAGARKAQLLFKAAEIDLPLPESDLKDARESKDPKAAKRDKVGFANRVKFDPLAVVEKIQTMDFETANAYIRSEMVHSCYSRLQRQMMMAALAGHLRRNGASKARLRALYTEMRNIAPQSLYGAYADGAIALWASESAPEKPAAIAAAPVEIDRAADNISTADAYDPTRPPKPADGGSGSGSASPVRHTALGDTVMPTFDDSDPTVETTPAPVSATDSAAPAESTPNEPEPAADADADFTTGEDDAE